jgi:hypothetical protein
MVIFPFSKLLHAPGVFFSPTRNQVDSSRLEAQGAGDADAADVSAPQAHAPAMREGAR